MRDSWIGCILGAGRRRILVCQSSAHNFVKLSFVVVIDGLAWMNKKYSVLVRAFRLQDFNRVVALGGAVRTVGRIGVIEGICLLAQDRPAKSTASFTHLLPRKVIG